MQLTNNRHVSKNPNNCGCILETEHFKHMVKSWGATLVGVGDVSEGLAMEFRHLPVAVSLAVAHPSVARGIVSRKSVTAYTNCFPAVDAVLENIQKRIVSYLRSLGWRAFNIPPDTGKIDHSFASALYPLFPHKTAATCSGLGWVGKNGLLVTPEHGARLSWGTVLTNAPLTVAVTPYLRGKCGNCTRCMDLCPAGAITPDEWVRGSSGPKINIDACMQQLKENHRVLGTYICGLCVTVCPLSTG